MINEAAIETAREAISKAFADVPRPDDGNFALYESVPGSDGWYLADRLKRYKREHIPANVLAECYELPLLSNSAFHYFLSAFMLGRLLNPEQVDVAGDSVVASLLPPDNQTELDQFEERLKGFTPQQRHSIKLFLKAVATDTQTASRRIRVIEAALADYWSKY